MVQREAEALPTTSGTWVDHQLAEPMQQLYPATAPGSYTVTVTNSNTCTFTSPAYVITENALPTAGITGATSFCTGGNTFFFLMVQREAEALPTTSGTWVDHP